MRRSMVAMVGLGLMYGGLALGLTRQQEQQRPRAAAAAPRQLPGIERASGMVRLPNQWALHPTGRHLPLGDFPVNMVIHPTGSWLAVLHAGFGDHEIITFDIRKNPRRLSRVLIDQAFAGLCFSPDGKTLFVSGGEYGVVHTFAFDEGLLSDHRMIRVAPLRSKLIPAGLAADAHTLYVAGSWGHAVSLVPLDDPSKRQAIDMPADSYPYVCLPEPGGKRLFVSLWGKAAVAVLDLEEKKLTATWPTESHPSEMVLSPNGKTLFVACANSTRVSVLNTATGKTRETISCALYPGAPVGNTPSSLALTPDGQILFVASSDASNLAVIQVAKPGQARPLGFIPTGWYPTSVRYDAASKRILVANGKGLASHPNPQGPGPYANPNLTPVYQYIGGLFHGALSVIDMPGPEKLAEYSKQAYACSPLRSDQGVSVEWPKGNPIPKKVGDTSPIKYCFYIIKENRTYDQVFGDVKGGNGDPNLCLFGEKITPNHHKLVREFVLLDNFYTEGEVSADGHQWTMGAYATDFVEKVWPLSYRGSPFRTLQYPSEGNYDSIARGAGGYLWDRCAEARVSYRSYGEWTREDEEHKGRWVAAVPALKGHIDPDFHGWDLDYPDTKRAERFISELKRFERDGGMPSLTILRLPNDHTAGTRKGSSSPRAMVADNDLALGQVVEAISKSKFWKESAIFVIEDDSQNGPDHVDAHRTVALVISPYTKRHFVDSSLYSTTSMLRTMELILGLKPMSQFDAAARPMYHAFQAEADLTPYEHVPARIDRDEKNKADAWGAEVSAKFNFQKEDAADDLLLNEVIWRSIKGPNSVMPAPVRAAFVMPKPGEDEDDD